MKSNQAKTGEAKDLARRRRSTYLRAPRHGKHTDVQGFPNNRGMTPMSKTREAT